MKRLALALVLSLAACSTGTGTSDPTTEPEAGPRAGTMSNLVDAASQDEVRQILADAGIPKEAVEEFFAQVDAFHADIPTDSLTTGFESLDKAQNYDISGMVTGLTEADARLTNCRITTFVLAPSILTVGQTGEADTTMLFMDHDSIERAPALFGPDQLAQFDTFYGRIPTTAEKDTEAHINDIQSYFADHDISFADSDASIISVFEHDNIDDPAAMFIGHIGLLVEADDELLFIEKLAFEEPYQAVWFADRSQLNDYLMDKYSGGNDLEYSPSLIFENGEVMEGYKAD